ncbi:MAG TPA: methyltransferase domain-containing protein [Caldilineaceae bacterium]|nr:methyltransferase domain-containing protein [Caldilineaceae bacterium]
MTQPPLRTFSLHYSLRRYFIDHFMDRVAAQLPVGSRVLDLGGHKKVKRGAFDIGRYDLHVLYANLTADKSPDLQADAAALPLPTATFDVVICTELLEHVPEPRRVLAEATRVLRPGGTLVITAPFLYPIHADPYDFGRYTETYWRYLLAELGFTQVQVEAQGLLFAAAANMLKLTANQVRLPGPVGRLLRGLALVGLVAPLQMAALALEQSRRLQNHPYIRSYTTGYGIVAIRPEAT